jgi:uncharacterized protein (TIGR02246 family)
LDVGTSVEVADLFARYNAAADRSDAEAWAATFAEDGVYQSGDTSLEGRESLVAYMQQLRGESPAAPAGALHLTTNLRVRRDGRWASATSNFAIVSTATGNDLAIAGFGTFADELVQAGGWLLRRRTVEIVARSKAWPAGLIA